MAKLARDTGVDATHVRRLALGAQLVELPDGADARDAALALKARGGVAIAVPDRHVRRAKVPNEPVVPDQRRAVGATYQQFTATMNWSAEGIAFCANL